MIGGNNTITKNDDGHTAREEAEGKEIWGKLQAKELKCEDLSDENFGALGEYFMGQMAGEQHEAMNDMMIQMMGEEGEEQMHITMGKRMSGCEPNAPIPQTTMNSGMMPMMMMMMQMMMGGWSSPFGFNQTNNPMMNFEFSPLGGLGWIFMILWWVLIIAGIVALIKWLADQFRGGSRDQRKSPLEILKERYAKGEIDKKEFEEKKKVLS